MTASIKSYTFLIFAIANAIFIPIIYIFYPETKGRTLEAIDRESPLLSMSATRQSR